jgi:hypothetical protein
LPGNVDNVADCERRPARLMTGPEAEAGFTVEVFVEKDEVAPVWVIGESRFIAMARSAV